MTPPTKLDTPPGPAAQATAPSAGQAPTTITGAPNEARNAKQTKGAEDFSLRFAPRHYRRWTPAVVAGSALGGIAYLADFSIGASIGIQHGTGNAIGGILIAAVLIFISSFPLAYYAARYNVDLDLISRGSGFGYLGSILTNLIFVSFTFILFATEGAIMAQGLKLGFGLPLWAGYLVSSLMIIPLVMYGMKILAKLQSWTNPLWLIMMGLPLAFLLIKKPDSVSTFMAYSGENGEGVNFASMMLAAGVCLSLTAQIAENIDYLRFMPPKTPENKRSWWTAVILGGPGWVFLGAAKQIIGVFLAVYIIANLNQSTDMAMEPVNQFLSMYKEMMPGWLAVALAVFLVVVSQIKINVTNAYSGSLAWTNIYSRTFKRYPGRITFVVLNVGIALALMEFNMFQVLGFVLSFYSNFAIAWIFTVAADIVFNKYLLKLSPLEPEFRRGMLYNVNPVGVVSVLAAGGISVAMFFGAFGDGIAAFSPLFSAIIAVIVTPLMAVITKGRYYLRRSHDGIDVPMFDEHGNPSDHKLTCAITGEEVERPDMVASAKTGPNGETLYVSSLALTLDTTGEHVLPADNNVVRRRTPRRRTVE
ncbi:purine-cytosine permease family protein [Corynebacterium falsenii]|uniref:purine-cytosine permease family protein n=1 Tax=Corynebacterium falsenii TaxID=108486 RepID=UPI003FD0D997